MSHHILWAHCPSQRGFQWKIPFWSRRETHILPRWLCMQIFRESVQNCRVQYSKSLKLDTNWVFISVFDITSLWWWLLIGSMWQGSTRILVILVIFCKKTWKSIIIDINVCSFIGLITIAKMFYIVTVYFTIVTFLLRSVIHVRTLNALLGDT